MKKITRFLNLTHCCLVSVLLASTVSFAQMVAPNPIYDLKGTEIEGKRDMFAKHFLNEDGS